jgi:putative flippase GtrA
MSDLPATASPTAVPADDPSVRHSEPRHASLIKKTRYHFPKHGRDSALARRPSRLYSTVATQALRRELLGFLSAGSAAYMADLLLFIWLRGPVGMTALTAKSLSFLAGCTVAYLGNSLVTYRGRNKTGRRARQYIIFFAFNLGGASVQMACLTLSHHLVGFTSQRADVLSGSVIGMFLATLLRFWGTRKYTFAQTLMTCETGQSQPGAAARNSQPTHVFNCSR